MSFELEFTRRAQKDLSDLKKNEPKSFLKLKVLLGELQEHPRTGTGRPEMLKHELSGYWSRRIDRKNRLVYQIHDEVVLVSVLSAKGHYDDK